jgi:hypothetical protein
MSHSVDEVIFEMCTVFNDFGKAVRDVLLRHAIDQDWISRRMAEDSRFSWIDQKEATEAVEEEEEEEEEEDCETIV